MVAVEESPGISPDEIFESGLQESAISERMIAELERGVTPGTTTYDEVDPNVLVEIGIPLEIETLRPAVHMLLERILNTERNIGYALHRGANVPDDIRENGPAALRLLPALYQGALMALEIIPLRDGVKHHQLRQHFSDLYGAHSITLANFYTQRTASATMLNQTTRQHPTVADGRLGASRPFGFESVGKPLVE